MLCLPDDGSETLPDTSSRSYPKHPLIGVCTLCWDGENMLVIKRGREPYKNHWALPGGLVELGETLDDAALRELSEETGVRAKIVGQLETFDSIQRDQEDKVASHFVLTVFEAEHLSGDAIAADDALAAKWCRPEELSSLLMTPGTHERLLGAYKRRNSL